MWVMITGIRNLDDALRAWSLGANALGLLVKHVDDSKSGFISPTIATSITKRLSRVPKRSPSFRRRDQQECQNQPLSSPIDNGDSFPKPPGRIEGFCECVLVTHLIDVQKIANLAYTIGVTTIQLVGKNTPEDVRDIKDILPNIEIIKSIPVTDHSCMDQVKKYMDIVDAIELDTIDIATNKFGGTGKTHDWTISQKIVQEYGYKVPIILAGGLDSNNIERAIQLVKPFGVDVSSGIKDKDSRGIQNERLVAPFISRAKKRMKLPSLSSLRLVAMDLDGTLLRSDHTISAYTSEILRRLQALGITVVLLSARPARTLRLFAREADIGGLAICSNGAIIYDLDQDCVLQEHMLLPEQVKQAISLLRAALPHLSFAADTGKVLLYETAYPEASLPPDVCAPCIGETALLWQQAQVKILAYHPSIPVEELYAIVTPLLDSNLYNITYSGGAFLEIALAGVQKGTALARFCAQQGIENQETIAFGDMPNDLPLLQWAGYSVAVANAHPLVIQAAGMQTFSNDEDGVASLLAQLLETEYGH